MRNASSFRLCGPTPGVCIWRTSVLASAPIPMIPSHEVGASCRDYVLKSPCDDTVALPPQADRGRDMLREDR